MGWGCIVTPAITPDPHCAPPGGLERVLSGDAMIMWFRVFEPDGTYLGSELLVRGDVFHAFKAAGARPRCPAGLPACDGRPATILDLVEEREDVVSDPRRRPRRHSWNRSQSDSFGPIKQVGVAIAIGFPLLVIGVLMVVLLMTSVVGGTTTLWLLGGGLVLAGLIAAISGRII